MPEKSNKQNQSEIITNSKPSSLFMKIRLMSRRDNKVSVPVDQNGQIKVFLFEVDLQKITEIISEVPEETGGLTDVVSEHLLDEGGINLMFFEFLINLGFKEVHLLSVEFQLNGINYYAPFTIDYYMDDYTWTDDLIHMIDENYGRHSTWGYEYSTYLDEYEMPKSNYEFTE